MSHLFLNRLRLSNPWRYKAPFLISIPYFLIFLGHIPPEQAAFGILMSCCTILGLAGFGYLLNDFTDQEEDRKAGKFNLLLSLSALPIALLFLLFLALAILPWVFYFPKGWSTLGLLGLELLLFVLYSAPPFRFKEQGWLGVLCDAGYAHAVPAVLAALTFFYLGDRSFTGIIPLVLALGLWQGVVGIRNILLHMQSDLEKDNATGTKTLGVRMGSERLERLLKRRMVPFEVLAFSLFGGLVMLEVGWFAVFVLIYYLQMIYKQVVVNGKAFPRRVGSQLTLLLDDLYVLWWPWFVLLNLIVVSPWFALLAVAHTLIFRNALWELWRESKTWVMTQRVKFALLAMLVIMTAQLVQIQRTGEYFPALILPMFSQAHNELETPHFGHEIYLENANQSQKVSMHSLLPEVFESVRATLLRQNMGPEPGQQNKEADWQNWLSRRVREKWQEASWDYLIVSWFEWKDGHKINEVGTYRLPLKGDEHG